MPTFFEPFISTMLAVILPRAFYSLRCWAKLAAWCFALTAVSRGTWNAAAAQTVHFSGAQSVVTSNGLATPHGVAVDASGNIYIADVGNNRILKETLSGGGYVESTVASSGLNKPAGVAVDTNGNVFIADTMNSRILKETLSGGTYTESIVPTTGLRDPLGIAVDHSGNLFITDSYNAQVVKETYAGGVYTQSVVMGGPTWPDGVAVDSSGNVYVCAPSDGYVAKLTPSGSGYTMAYIGSMLGQPHGVAVDAAGNVYIADGSGNRILKETLSGGTYTQSILESTGLNEPQALAVGSNGALYFNAPNGGVIYKLSQSGANFSATAVGTQSSTLSLVFTFDTAGNIDAPSVVTQGVPNLDFTDAGTGTCTINGSSHNYAIGDTCIVDVTFKPKAPGARYGAAVIKNNAGTVIATGYAQGVGSGPQVSFVPGAQSTLSFGGLANYGPMAVDAAGSIYLVSCPTAYDPSCGIFKETWNGSGYTQTTVVSAAGTSYFPYGYPGAIAVDGVGNVFFTDPEDSQVVEAMPSDSGYTVSVPFPYKGTVWGVAVDGSGNVFIGSFALGLIKETRSGSSYIQSTVARTTYANGIAVDGAGNLYVSNTTSSLFKETPLNGGYVQTAIASNENGYHAVALDGGGNVYATESYGHNVYKEILSGGNYTENTIATIGENTYEPSALALDGNGNVYISVNGTPSWGPAESAAFKLDFADPPSLSFASTAYGATSSDSPQTVTVENTGNAALTFPIPSSGSNPSISSSFTLNSGASSACPLVNAGSAAVGTLAAGASCQLSINFVPVTVGTNSGSLVLTDDSLNVTTPSYATQSIQLSGTATQATPSVSWATPLAITYGTALSNSQLNATASVPGTFVYSPAVGTVPAVGSDTLSVTFTPNDTINYSSATAHVLLTVNSGVPVLSSLSPIYANAGGSAFTLTVTGTGFVSSSTIYWGSTALTTTYVSATQLTAQVTAAEIAVTGTSAVTVQTPSSGGGTSNTVTFEVDSASSTSSDAPTLTTLVATVAAGATANYSVTLPSTASGISVACLNLPANATCSYSSSAGAIAIATSSNTPAGTYQITVVFTENVSETAGILLPLLLLPLFLMRRKLATHGTWPAFFLGVIVLSGTVFAIGCGGNSSPSSSGIQTQQVRHSGTVTLTVR